MSQPHSSHPHRKQWIIATGAAIGALQHPLEWRSLPLGGGLQLTHCPQLPVAHATNAQGELVVLLGRVVESVPARAVPETVLPQLTLANHVALTESWAGHYVLLIGDQLVTDCLGLATVFMPRAPLAERSGVLAISSSPALLQQVYGLPPEQPMVKILQPFAVAPWCFVPELRGMLAGQVLSLSRGEITTLPDPVFTPTSETPEAVRQRAADMLRDTLRALAVHQPAGVPFQAALTGGYDTRLNLAAALAAGVPVESFTFVKPYLYITEADRLLPQQIAARVGVTHRRIQAQAFDLVRADAYLAHAGGGVTRFRGSGYDHDTHGYWQQLGPHGYVLDGQCYELAVNYHRHKFRPDFTRKDLLQFGFGISEADYDELQAHWALQCRDTAFDRRDLLFWSGNINGVYARMTQEHDRFTDLFFPACNRALMNTLLAVPIELREACRFEATVTAALVPVLDAFPYNPPEPLFKRAAKRLRGELFRRMGW